MANPGARLPDEIDCGTAEAYIAEMEATGTEKGLPTQKNDRLNRHCADCPACLEKFDIAAEKVAKQLRGPGSKASN